MNGSAATASACPWRTRAGSRRCRPASSPLPLTLRLTFAGGVDLPAAARPRRARAALGRGGRPSSPRRRWSRAQRERSRRTIVSALVLRACTSRVTAAALCRRRLTAVFVAGSAVAAGGRARRRRLKLTLRGLAEAGAGRRGRPMAGQRKAQAEARRSRWRRQQPGTRRKKVPREGQEEGPPSRHGCAACRSQTASCALMVKWSLRIEQ